MKSYCAYGDRALFRCMRWGVCVVLFVGWASESLAKPQWVCATDEAWKYSEREGFSCVVFKDKLWVLGGEVEYCDDESPGGMLVYQDIWNSSDGTYWERQVSPPWEGRYGHTSLIFQDKIWVLGGGGKDNKSDVWCSEDGQSWILTTDQAPWPPRIAHTSVVFDNKIWILGGRAVPNSSRLSDVWCSEDGIMWTEVTNDAPWGAREEHTSVVFDNKIWVLGGYSDGYKNDVWSSTNGKVWDKVTSDATWPAKKGHASVVFQNRMWVFGGMSGGNDVWHSSDGIDWEQFPEPAPWSGRDHHSVAKFQDKLWVLGGGTGRCELNSYELNDVWYTDAGLISAFTASPTSASVPLTVQFTDESLAFSTTITDWTWDFGDGTGSSEQNPSHIYAQRGVYTVSLTVGASDDSDTNTKERYIRVNGEQHAFHSADGDRNGRISLSELLRVIQFYNYGAFHCAVGTEDGYAPGPGGMECGLYDGDYAPPDGRLNLSEVLRVIQFFNGGGYRACLDGEDGFCPGAGG